MSFVPDDEHLEQLAWAIEKAKGRPRALKEAALGHLTDEQFLEDSLRVFEQRELLYLVCTAPRERITPKAEPTEDLYGDPVEPEPSLLEMFHDEVLTEVETIHFSTSNISRFLQNGDEPVEPDWVIPGFLAHSERLVLTGNPGAGKSHFGAQICWDAAHGIHPLTGEPIAKRARTLFVNLEINDDDITAMFSKFGPLDPYAEMRIGEYQSGVEVMDPDDLGLLALKREVESFQPDIIWLAGAYKMSADDLGMNVKAVRAIQALADYWRMELASKPAVMLEAQKGHNGNRPKGGKEWEYWPEFGLHLTKPGDVSEWRERRNDRRFVPDKLERANGRWMLPRDIGKLCFEIIEAEGHMSNQALGDRLGVSKHTIGRAFSSDDKDEAVKAFEAGQQ